MPRGARRKKLELVIDGTVVVIDIVPASLGFYWIKRGDEYIGKLYMLRKKQWRAKPIPHRRDDRDFTGNTRTRAATQLVLHKLRGAA